MLKNANNLRSSRPVDTERQCWVNAQYSKRECLDIVDISSEVKDETLEGSVNGNFDEPGCSIDTDQIEAWH